MNINSIRNTDNYQLIQYSYMRSFHSSLLQTTTRFFQCVVHAIPIVSEAFLDAYIKCAREHNPQLPNVADFFPVINPPCNEFVHKKDIMNIRPERQRLFQNKTFVFMQKHQMSRFQTIISLAAGKCVAMDSNNMRKSFLCKPECIPVQYTPPENTQSPAGVEETAKYIVSNGRRLIKEYEIGMAILKCSTVHFCNPQSLAKKNSHKDMKTAKVKNKTTVNKLTNIFAKNQDNNDVLEPKKPKMKRHSMFS